MLRSAYLVFGNQRQTHTRTHTHTHTHTQTDKKTFLIMRTKNRYRTNSKLN